MKRFLCLMILAVCLAVGCSSHLSEFHYINAPNGYSPIALKVIKVHMDKNFGAADKVALDNALMQWNYALNGYLRLELVDTNFDMQPDVIRQCMLGNCWMILKTDSNNPMVAELDKTKKGKSYTLAWADSIGGNRMWMIRDRMSNEWVTGIALHEMGHLLGAEHDDVYLMQPMFHWEQARCVDYEALRRVAEYQHLPFSKLNYCIYGSLGLGHQENIK